MCLPDDRRLHRQCITTLFSICLIWFGINMLRECNRMVEEARAKQEAKKALSRKAAEDLSDVSGVWGPVYRRKDISVSSGRAGKKDHRGRGIRGMVLSTLGGVRWGRPDG